ncbi:class I SAM-dependent methyltransferase [Natronomonas sp.]|uniref:class I SAM-dependent methyltransferase n=1 Tax=Natronomonas sp. TaxID=2184060 RepID=UPI0026238F9F|nr:class I SAM-dependent methyltransferase family protein [Natronomonas sp.]
MADADTTPSGSPSEGLGAIVEKPRAEAAIGSLRSEGVYDDARRVEPYDEAHVAIPVVAPPTATAVSDVRTVKLPRRVDDLGSVLERRGANPETIAAAPSSWAVVGDVVLVDFGDVSVPGTLGPSARETVAEALLELHGNAATVLARGGIDGPRRDPSVTVVAGADRTETVHVEHGTTYAIDFSSVMFSPGNKAERARMGRAVDDGERVFDMFAGIGYFALPMARAGASVIAAEIDPDAHRLLVENARRNGVADRVRAERADCRTVGADATADRVVAGYYDAFEYLDTALDALAPGGVVHLHEATPEPLFPSRPIERLRAAAADGRSIETLEPRVVKSHSAGVVHGVVDARVR